MKPKNYKIFSKTLANILCQQGFQIIDIQINNKHPWMYVYTFKNSKELQAIVKKYMEKEVEYE